MLNLSADDQGIFFSNPMLLKYLYTTQRSCFENLHVYPIREYERSRRTILIHHKRKHLSRPIVDSIGMIQDIYQSHRSVMKFICPESSY